MTATTPLQLVRLSDAEDLKVCGDDADPRGWKVVDSNENTLGTVTDLIIDEPAMLARYMVCSVDRAAREVLIPVGFARLDQKVRTVCLDFVTAEDIERIPDFTGLPLNAEFGARLTEALTGVAPSEEGPARIVRRTNP